MVIRPDSVSGSGLFQALEGALLSLDTHAIDDTHCSKLVGIATDGASANCLNRLVERKFTWIFLDGVSNPLAIKDAQNGTAFELIDEMLLRLHYLYEKSPKKCEDIALVTRKNAFCSQVMVSSLS